MKRNDLQEIYLPVPEDCMEAIKDTVESIKEDNNMVKPKSWVLMVALILLLFCGTALGIGSIAGYYSVAKTRANDNPNETFLRHMVEIHERHENEYFTFTINDAVFDGREIEIAMNIEMKDPETTIMLYPRLTATSGGQELMVDIEGTSLLDFFSGGLYPSIDPEERQYYTGEESVSAVIMEGDQKDDVVWTLQVMVLKPNWPMENMEQDAALESDYEAYLSLFKEAYQQKKILVTWGNSLVEYANELPLLKEDGSYYSLGEQLANSDAFELVETIESVFASQTPEDYLRNIGKGETFIFEDYTVEFQGITASFVRLVYALDVVFPEGTSQEALEGKALSFALRMGEDNPTTPISYGSYVDTEGRPIIHFTGEMNLNGKTPASVTFIPFTKDGGAKVYREDQAFTIELGAWGKP